MTVGPEPRYPNARRMALLGLAAIFAVLGQLSLAGSPPYIVDGVTLFAVAALLFSCAVGESRPAATTRPATALEAIVRHPWRTAALALAPPLVVSLLRLLARQPAPAGFARAWTLWLASILTILAGVGALQRRGRAAAPLEPRWPAWPWLLGLFSLALALRVWRLGSLPATLSGDEGNYGLEIVRVLAGQLRNPFVTGWSGTPTLGFFFAAPSLWLFGQDSFGLRLPWALVGASTVVLALLLGRRLEGRLVGLLTGLFLTTWGFHVHYSRIGVGNAADGFLAASGVLLLARALDSGSIRSWAGAGFVAGISLYAYTGARLVPLLLAALVLAAMARGGGAWQRHRGGIGAMVLVAAAVSAPMLQFAVLHREDFNARIGLVGIIQSGSLEAEMARRQSGALPVLVDQLQRSALAFNLYPDRSAFYDPGRPLLGFVAGIFFLVGLGHCTLNAWKPRYLPMTLWWWAGLCGSILTVNPPESQRMNILAVPTAFFIAVAVARTSRLVASVAHRRRSKTWGARLALVVIALLGIGSSWEYFTSYSQSLTFGNPNSVVATRWARYAREHLAADTRFVFFAAPRMYANHGTISYLAPHLRGEDVIEPLRAPLPEEHGCSPVGSAFVFLPERFDEIEFVAATFPGGRLSSLPSSLTGKPLFHLYQVQQACGPAASEPK